MLKYDNLFLDECRGREEGLIIVKMYSKYLVLIVILLEIFTPNTIAQCLSANDERITSKTVRSSLYTGERNFTLSLLQATNLATPKENIFISPYSTYHALLLAYFGAQHETELSLKNVLNLDWAVDKVDVMQAYRLVKQSRLLRFRNSSVIFNSADKIFMGKQTKLRDCLQDILHDEFETLDFLTDAEGSRLYINKFIEAATSGNIKDILIPGSLTSATNLVLANAAYFKGQWASMFDPKNTTPEIFYSSSDKHSFTDMMHKKDNFNYANIESLQCHVLEIPYLGKPDDISMFILLPTFMTNSIDEVLSRLTLATLREALDYGMSREVELSLPKFAFEKTYQLVPILSRMGIGNLFESSADLTGFTGNVNLSLDEAVHKAKIEVNEEGSTAAAATVLFSFRSSRPLEPTQFNCNHPFIFLIYDREVNAILFSGIYRGPEE